MSAITLTAGLIQREIVPHDPAGNLFSTLETMQRLVEQEVDLICLSELWLTGMINPTDAESSNVVSTIDGPTVDALRDFCRTAGIYLSAGTIALKEKDGLKNSALIIDPSGEIALKYDKVHLFAPMGEDRVYEPGDSLEAVDINGVGVGVIVCYDLRFPSMSRTLARAGVEVILVPAMWPDARIYPWETLLRARAMENQVYVVGINGLCNQNGVYIPGHSMFVGPHGDALNQPEMRESVIVRKLDISKLRKLRSEICYLDEEVEISDVNWHAKVNESGG